MENSKDCLGFLQCQGGESVFLIHPAYMLFLYGIDFESEEVEGTPNASSVIALYAKAEDS